MQWWTEISQGSCQVVSADIKLSIGSHISQSNISHLPPPSSPVSRHIRCDTVWQWSLSPPQAKPILIDTTAEIEKLKWKINHFLFFSVTHLIKVKRIICRSTIFLKTNFSFFIIFLLCRFNRFYQKGPKNVLSSRWHIRQGNLMLMLQNCYF